MASEYFDEFTTMENDLAYSQNASAYFESDSLFSAKNETINDTDDIFAGSVYLKDNFR